MRAGQEFSPQCDDFDDGYVPEKDDRPEWHKSGETYVFNVTQDFGRVNVGDSLMYKLGSHLHTIPEIVLAVGRTPGMVVMAIGYLDECGVARRFVMRSQADVDLLNANEPVTGRGGIDPPLGEVYGTCLPGVLV